MTFTKFATTSLCFAICAGTFTLSPALSQDTYVYQEQRLQTQEVSEPAAQAEAGEAEVAESDEMSNPVVTEAAPQAVEQNSTSSTTVETSPSGIEQSTTTTTVETSAPLPGSLAPLSTESSSSSETTIVAPAVIAPPPPVLTTPAVPVTAAPVAITLPTDRKYLLVNPMTGEIVNGFDPTLPESDLAALAGMVVVERSTGRLVAGINSGRTVDIAVMTAGPTMLSSIDQRRAELDRMITASVANGSLDASAATALRSKLDAIAAQRGRFISSDNSLSFAETITLAYGLNNLSDHLVTVTRAPALAPLSGTRFTITDGRISYMGDLDYRIYQLTKRVDSEYTLGRLSSRQAADLKQRLNDISEEQDRNLQRGSLDASKVQDLVMRLDDVGARLARSIASR